jgi:hypothetical protein
MPPRVMQLDQLVAFGDCRIPVLRWHRQAVLVRTLRAFPNRVESIEASIHMDAATDAIKRKRAGNYKCNVSHRQLSIMWRPGQFTGIGATVTKLPIESIHFCPVANN